MCRIIQKIHFCALEVVKTTSRWHFWSKSIFWLWGNFEKNFSRFFFCKRLKKKLFFKFDKYGLSSFQRRFKCQKILKIDQSRLIWNLIIFVIFQIFFSKFQKFAQNSNFQAFLEQKLKVVWKNLPAQKMCRIIQKIHFFALEVVKTTSRCFFLAKIDCWKKSIFLFVGHLFFKLCFASAWKNCFFQNLKNSISQLSYALSSVKKYLKLTLLS